MNWADRTTGGMPVRILHQLDRGDVGSDGIGIIAHVFWGDGWNVETFTIDGIFRKDGRASGFDLIRT